MEKVSQQRGSPFVIEHFRLEEVGRHFVPTARLHVTPHARTQGILKKLFGRDARVLLALMSHINTNGNLQVSARQVASAIGVPIPIAAVWLRHLAHRRIHGVPLLQQLSLENGLKLYTISHHHLEHVNLPPVPDASEVLQAAGRQAVMDHVRQTYAIPRTQAEFTVMMQLGLNPEELPDTIEAHVWRELRYLKLKRDDIQILVDVFGVEEVRQQLEWLPERKGKPDARSLVKALINEYGPPRRLRDVLESYQQKKRHKNKSNNQAAAYTEPAEEGENE